MEYRNTKMNGNIIMGYPHCHKAASKNLAYLSSLDKMATIYFICDIFMNEMYFYSNFTDVCS